LNRSPNIAVFLTLLLPGTGHLYAGRAVRGLVILALVTALTFAGWALVGPAYLSRARTEIAVPLTQIRFAIPIALPEIMNFVETVVAHAWLKVVHPDTPLKGTAPFGFCMTAAAAMVTACAAGEAHWLCRRPPHVVSERSPGTAAMLAWLLPGLGHVYLGRRAKGLLVGSVLCATFLLGVLLAERAVVQRERDLYFWSGEVLCGLPALVATVVNAGVRVTRDIAYAEMGLLFTTVAGLLNVLLVIDAYTTAERDALGLSAQEPAPSPSPAPDAAPIAAAPVAQEG